ncbi:MAG: EAL domain-containing protein [Gammaproteobacteria bacterium]|nr:EAL domain-containing protein [Gammaproteobacteria bacterium]
MKLPHSVFKQRFLSLCSSMARCFARMADTEQALHEAERHYREVVENAAEIIYTTDIGGNFIYANPAALRCCGLSLDQLRKLNCLDLVPESHRARISRIYMRQYLARLEATYAEFPCALRSGEQRWFAQNASLVMDGDRIMGFHLIARDITERKQMEESLRVSEERYMLAVRGANDGLWDWNLKTGEIYFSPRWKAMLGYAESDVRNSPEEWFGLIHPEDSECVQAEIDAHLQGRFNDFESEYRMRDRDGTYRWMLSRGAAIRDGTGKATRVAGSQVDITERKATEQLLLRNALHDTLTNLPNRALFMDRLGLAIHRAKRRDDYKFAVLFLDLDRFKSVNDSLGHIIGDQLLINVGQRLAACLRPGDTVARLGGDEFAILLEDIRSVSDATDVTARIREEMKQPIQLGGQQLFISVSTGIALSGDDHNQPEELLRNADIAMYRAKARGKGRAQVFDAGMHTHTQSLRQLEAELSQAVEREELCLHYQPVISMHDGAVVGFEALLRWQHPERGLLPPEAFVPVAEESGLITAIDRWALREACQQLSQWQVWHPSLTVSVNVSGKQFGQADLAGQVAAALKESGINPPNLCLEITEAVTMHDPQEAGATFAQLRALGVQLHMDDFGTGYSSLSYLHRFRFDAFKIDSSFIHGMSADKENTELVRALITLATSLGVRVIAEGVETAEQSEQLKTLRCAQAQGYYFSPALEPEAAERLVGICRAEYA